MPFTIHKVHRHGQMGLAQTALIIRKDLYEFCKKKSFSKYILIFCQFGIVNPHCSCLLTTIYVDA